MGDFPKVCMIVCQRVLYPIYFFLNEMDEPEANAGKDYVSRRLNDESGGFQDASGVSILLILLAVWPCLV